MGVELDFVKGHCGWDAVTLIPQGQIAAADELSSALKILGPPIYGGLEVGWLGRGEWPDEIKLRIVDSTTKTWLPMCGGMTQVIGKALVETFLRDHFKVDVTRPVLNMKLVTAAGRIPIQVAIRDRKATTVTTTMDDYVAYLYQHGVERLVLEDVPFLRVGAFAVIDVAALTERYPGVDFTRRDNGPHLDIVNEMLRAFMRRLDTAGVYGMLYDDRPEKIGQFRVFPRFFSNDLTVARFPWEFQCGTGSIAVAVALAHEDRLPIAPEGDVLFEWGSHKATPDPYGVRTSLLHLQLTERRVTKAAFSHSVVEILSEGRMTLPQY